MSEPTGANRALSKLAREIQTLIDGTTEAANKVAAAREETEGLSGALESLREAGRQMIRAQGELSRLAGDSPAPGTSAGDAGATGEAARFGPIIVVDC
jgi:hypothetical protein